MKYFIEINSWNLLESFVTESISPFSFYQERDFGNNLSRYLSGEKERTDWLILSEKDLGGDYAICVDDTLIDCKALTPVKGLKTVYTYPKSIYYRKGFVQFRFGTIELRESLIAESTILLEVKCLEKYSSSFYVRENDSIERKGISKLGNPFSFDKNSFINYDNRYNKTKGAVVGYVRGIYTSSNKDNQILQTELRNLKNSFGGFNTQIMMSDSLCEDNDIIGQIYKCKDLYFNQIDSITSFDVLIAQYQEIVKLATLRVEEILSKNSNTNRVNKGRLLDEKTNLENQITNIEKSYNIFDVRLELANIKAIEKAQGEAVGKTRQYFKKGTAEYERKVQLKHIIEDFEKNNFEYGKIQMRLRQIEQEMDADANKYDSTLSALFTRVSDILNELIKKASSVTNKDAIDLSIILFDKDHLTIKNSIESSEICYFNILLKYILTKTSGTQPSEYAVLESLVESAKVFKEDPLSKNEVGESILNYLRAFLLYKNQKSDQLLIPDSNTPIFQSIFSFFVKPLGFEQMERYMLLKKIPQKEYAFMLWGAWMGFADMPKTFTNVLYQNEEVDCLIDDKMQELF